MKKLLLFLILITLVFISACGTYDEKNKVEQYPNTDTTDKPETKNDPFADSTNKSQPPEHSVD